MDSTSSLICGIVGALDHLEVRKALGKPIVDRLRAWLDDMLPRFEPTTPMAIVGQVLSVESYPGNFLSE